MSWKIDVIALGGLAVGGYLVITNIDKIGEWISSMFPKAAHEVAETAGNLVVGIPRSVWGSGYDVGVSSGFQSLGKAIGETHQSVNQAYSDAGAYAAVGVLKANSALYDFGFNLGLATQSAIGWAGSVLFPQATPRTNEEIIRAAITPALNMAYANAYDADYVVPFVAPFVAPSLPSVDKYMATQAGVGSDVYSAAAASNLGTKYAGWEKLMLVSGGVVPKPGFDWSGGLPNKTEWAQYQAWLSYGT